MISLGDESCTDVCFPTSPAHDLLGGVLVDGEQLTTSLCQGRNMHQKTGPQPASNPPYGSLSRPRTCKETRHGRIGH